MLFAVEIILHEVSVRTLIPVALSTATATYIGRLFFGPYPSFVIPSLETPYFHLTNPLVLLSYVGLGVTMGFVSAVFIKSIYGFEDFFDKRVRGNYYTRHMIGMFLVGIIIYILMATVDHYHIAGVGYSTVQDVLSGSLSQAHLILILFALKLLATSLTLGSGASGGIFSPALYMGATLGGAYGIIIQHFVPGLAINPPAFAVAGMAGVVGGATGAAMAAIVMIFEMTLDYGVIIPMTITVALSYGVRKRLCKESIYTLKLARRGHYMPEALQTHFHELRRVKDIMDTHYGTVQASCTLNEFVLVVSKQAAVSSFLVEDFNRVIGVVAKDAAIVTPGQLRETITLAEIADKNYVAVPEDTTLFDVIARMRSKQASVALVTHSAEAVSPNNVKGLITRHQLGDAMMEAIELFSD